MRNETGSVRSVWSSRRRLLHLLVISHFAFCVSHSLAQTTQPTLSASVGFGGVFRPEAWTPVYVTIAAPASAGGVIDVHAARGRIGNVVSARVQANPRPTTFSMYVPLDPLDRVAIDWRDERGRQVTHLDFTETVRQNPAALGGPVFGVSGELANAGRVATQLVRDTGEFIAAGAISTRLLPERAIGYQALDVLVLPDLNTDEIDDAVEAQIARWVSAGGVLVTWPGAQAITADSPLAAILPVSTGEIITRRIDGTETAVRELRPLSNASIDLSDSRTVLFARDVGIGRVAVFGFDPTRVYRSIDDRIDAFRKATGGEVILSPDEERVGRYDPLIHQARGEEQLAPVEYTRPSWLWIALALGLVMGPGEALLLLLCRRPIVTPLTAAGFAMVVGAGLALSLRTETRPERAIEVIVETDEGVVARSVLSTHLPQQSAASSIIGRTSDPLHPDAGELILLQRQQGFAPGDEIRPLSRWLPRVRSIDFAAAPSKLLVSASLKGGSAQLQSADDTAWEKAVLLSGDQLRPIASVVEPGRALSLAAQLNPAIEADDGSTARRETPIEALAQQDEWTPLLMDRHLGARLVRLFERGGVTAIVARRSMGGTTQFVIHLQREN